MPAAWSALRTERPQIAPDRKKYIFYPGTQIVPTNAAPRVLNVKHSVSVHANVPKGGAEGVLFTMGGNDGGFVFYIKDKKLTYGYNYVADKRFKVQSNGGGVPEGDHIFSFEFTPTGKPDIAHGKGVPAHIELFIDGKPVGEGDLPVTIPLNLGLGAGVCIGSDSGSPVMTAEDYEGPFPFSGTVKKALVDVSGEPHRGQAGADAHVSRAAIEETSNGDSDTDGTQAHHGHARQFLPRRDRSLLLQPRQGWRVGEVPSLSRTGAHRPSGRDPHEPRHALFERRVRPRRRAGDDHDARSGQTLHVDAGLR